MNTCRMCGWHPRRLMTTTKNHFLPSVKTRRISFTGHLFKKAVALLWCAVEKTQRLRRIDDEELACSGRHRSRCRAVCPVFVCSNAGGAEQNADAGRKTGNLAHAASCQRPS